MLRAFELVLKSILLILLVKIVLQHIPPDNGLVCRHLRMSAKCQTMPASRYSVFRNRTMELGVMCPRLFDRNRGLSGTCSNQSGCFAA